MTYWFTSDNHFSHTNIIGYTNRPFKDINEMNEKMIENWNSVVKREDTVFHLGDFSMRNLFNTLKDRLIGNIVFIKGNHDEDSIINDLTIEYYGKFWHLVHNPEEANLDFNICGHVHNNWKMMKTKDGKIIYNCGVDVNDFVPISMKHIVKEIRKEFGNVI